MTIVKAGDNIFSALGFNDTDAENLRIRSQLMREIDEYIESHQLKQREAADLLGVTQARISNIKTGKIDQFTIDLLVNMLGMVGRSVKVVVSKAA